jgi:hypothetical protein
MRFVDRVAPDAEDAYFVVAPPCPSRFHEIGHILGARHDRLVGPNNSPFPYGHGSSMAKSGATS